jgi:hypothetical protein
MTSCRRLRASSVWPFHPSRRRLPIGGQRRSSHSTKPRQLAQPHESGALSDEENAAPELELLE